jgi:hypothetical protein
MNPRTLAYICLSLAVLNAWWAADDIAKSNHLSLLFDAFGGFFLLYRAFHFFHNTPA